MLAALKARFNGADDFCLRELTAGGQVLYALFLDGMTSGSDISDFVVRPLMENLRRYQEAMERDDLPGLIQLLDEGRRRKEEVDGH